MVYVGSWTAGALHGPVGLLVLTCPARRAAAGSHPRPWRPSSAPAVEPPSRCSKPSPARPAPPYASARRPACWREHTRWELVWSLPFLQGINAPEDYETSHGKWGSSGGFSLQSGGGRGREQAGREAGQQQKGRTAVGRAVWARGRPQPHSRVLFSPPGKSPRPLGFPVKAALPPWPPGHAETLFSALGALRFGEL